MDSEVGIWCCNYKVLLLQREMKRKSFRVLIIKLFQR